MGALSAYLVAYNAACMLGWAGGLALAVQSLAATGGDLTKVWAAAEKPLTFAQWAMLLEIVHAMTGAVRSPFVTTFLQVTSRVQILVWILFSGPGVTTTWGCGMVRCFITPHRLARSPAI